MTTNISFQDRALIQVFQRIEQTLASKPVNESILAKLNAEMNSSKTALKTMRLEIQLLNPNDKALWQRRHEEHTSSLTKLQFEIQKQRSALIQSARNQTKPGELDESYNDKFKPGKVVQTFDEARDHGNALQAESLALVARAQGNVNKTYDVGQDILNQLAAQHESLLAAADDLDTLDADMTRVQKSLRNLAKSIAGDRCVQMLCLLALLGIVVIIVLVAVGADGGKLNVPDDVREFLESRDGE